MAGAAGGIAVRRHDDGSLDIGFHRERARRLRSAARRRLWRGVRWRTARALATAVWAPRRERHVPA